MSETPVKIVTAVAHPNLAFVKYWGKADETINIPANSSISMNLSAARTTTTVTFSDALREDEITINNAPADIKAHQRVVNYLNQIRQMAQINAFANVTSQNDFPASAGIASSASAFASLALAGSRAAGLDLDEKQLSILARRGSGSASRSIPSGFVEWTAGTNNDDSYAYQIAPPEHWDINITTVIFSHQPKDISSSEGHRAAQTSPFYEARHQTLSQTLETVRRALLDKDFETFGQAVEREAISMHAIAMTAFPANRDWLSGIYYWQPPTLAMIQQVQQWRQDGLAVYLTIDAGNAVHLICENNTQMYLEEALADVLPAWDGTYIVNKPASGAWIVN